MTSPEALRRFPTLLTPGRLGGLTLKNKMVLPPMGTNYANPDASMSQRFIDYYAARAKGGFGLIVVEVAAIDPLGKAVGNELGIFDDSHIPGLKWLVDELHKYDTKVFIQLHHAGRQTSALVIGEPPVAPSPIPCPMVQELPRELTADEVEDLIDKYRDAAVRAKKAGFDGVELHGAHGYLICSFLSPELNRRDDAYGGDPERRARFLFEIIDGVRAATKPGFTLGVRLSPERWGLQVLEVRSVAERLLREGKIDFLDMSLWDVKKEPEDEALKGRTLGSYFSDLPRNGVALGAAGKIMSAQDARDVLAAGYDLPVLGRAAILHHDFPKRALADANFTAIATPVSEAYLRDEGLGPVFVNYMRTWKGFVEEAAA